MSAVPPFASIADMEARFDRRDLVELTNQDGTDSIDASRVTLALGRAQTEIVTAVAAKYDLAATALTTPALERLRDIACDLARYYLYRDTAPDGVKDRYQTARADLRDIRDGKTKLDSGSREVTARPEGVMVSVPPRVFGRENMGGY